MSIDCLNRAPNGRFTGRAATPSCSCPMPPTSPAYGASGFPTAVVVAILIPAGSWLLNKVLNRKASA